MFIRQLSFSSFCLDGKIKGTPPEVVASVIFISYLIMWMTQGSVSVIKSPVNKPDHKLTHRVRKMQQLSIWATWLIDVDEIIECDTIFSPHEKSQLHFVARSEQGDIVWCLAFLGTGCREPIFKVKKCSQCGRKRGHGHKLVIHDAFMKGWQNATAYKLTQAAMINPHSPLRARKTNSAVKMKRLIIMFILSLFLTPVWKDFLNHNALLGSCCCGSPNLHIFDVDFVWSFVTFFSSDAFGLAQTSVWGTLTREFKANTLMNN